MYGSNVIFTILQITMDKSAAKKYLVCKSTLRTRYFYNFRFVIGKPFFN